MERNDAPTAADLVEYDQLLSYDMDENARDEDLACVIDDNDEWFRSGGSRYGW